MPFTFSHPAIILPLKKYTGTALSFTGLIVGSMTPDFEYFGRMGVKSTYSHTLSGLFWFDLPLGLLLTFIYHQIVRDQLITNLPAFLNNRLNVYKDFNWLAYFKRYWLIVIISVLLGTASHLFWDDFTHPTGYFVERSHWLRRGIFWKGMQLPYYAMLQHISTIVGGIIMAIFIASLDSTANVQSDKKARYWFSVILIASFIFVTRVLTGLDISLYGNVIVTVISAFMIAVIVTPLLLLSTGAG